jgi:hypothetical protein
MTSPDQHSTYVAEEYGREAALRFHLSTRVFPYWTHGQITFALPKLNEVLADGDWDETVEWTYQDGSTRTFPARDIVEGLTLWGLEEFEEEES